MDNAVSRPSIALFFIATGRYKQFVNSLVQSAQKFFVSDCDLHYHLFTESSEGVSLRGIQSYEMAKSPRASRLTLHAILDEGFPLCSLHRYHYLLDYINSFQDCDYIFYIDVDMRFVAPVGKEILCPDGLTFVQHPGYWEKDGMGDYDENPNSTAYVDPIFCFDYIKKRYTAGGFQGGAHDEFIQMAQQLRENIEQDHANGIMAKWHDESHMNRWRIHKDVTGAQIIILNPGYCYPEQHSLKPPFPQKILALNKTLIPEFQEDYARDRSGA